MADSDDFDLLGNAVARVLRDAFSAAAETRAESAARLVAEERVLDERLRAVFAEVEELRTRATTEAEAIRAKALDDARSIIAGADAEIARARQVMAEERVRLDTELKDLVRNVHRAVDALERSVRGDHSQLFERATSEARMILRQARLHHRATAREVDRMIEAAAQEAAALRDSALSDAARVAARVRGVVHMEGPAPDGPAVATQRGLRPLAS